MRKARPQDDAPLIFVEVETGTLRPQRPTWEVQNAYYKEFFGYVKWDGRVREYRFYSYRGWYNTMQLKAIARFIDAQTKKGAKK